MKKRIVIAAFLALAFLPSNSYAQLDGRKPGLYAIVGGESKPLDFTEAYGMSITTSVSILGVSVDEDRSPTHYDGVSSTVEASDTFVLVTDPEQDHIMTAPGRCEIFWREMYPGNFIVVGLKPDREQGCRELTFIRRSVYSSAVAETYDNEGVGITAGSTITVVADHGDKYDMEWEQISDNSYEIKVYGLTPGEYGFLFRTIKNEAFTDSFIFGFTVGSQPAE